MTLRSASGLGPMKFENGDAGVTRLRLFNPNDSDSVAIVNGSRITVPAGQIVEQDLVGTATVRSTDALQVTGRASDQPMDNAVNASHDVQFASTNLRHPEVAALAITTQTCGSTTLVTTASVACQQGTSAAMVAAIPGATYEWSAVNAQILNGLGTNMVTLSFGFAPNASVSVVVKTPEGCVLNGTASITVRTPFQIAAFNVFPGSPRIGDTVTVTWSYTTSESPRTQKLTLTAPDGSSTIANIPLSDRSFTFVATSTGSWNASLYGSLVGGRRRSARSGNSTLPAPSPCFAGTANVPFTVSNPCVPAAGSVRFASSSLTQGQTTSVAISANAAWSLSSAQGNPLSRTSGTGDANVTFTANVVGNDTLTLNIFGECGNVIRTDSITVTAPAPPMTVKLTADTYTVSFNGFTSLHVVVSNAPGAGPTSFIMTSSRGNSIDKIATAPGDTLTFRYNRDLFLFDDTVTITVNYGGVTASDSIVIH